jgi:hypothetical protein
MRSGPPQREERRGNLIRPQMTESGLTTATLRDSIRPTGRLVNDMRAGCVQPSQLYYPVLVGLISYLCHSVEDA